MVGDERTHFVAYRKNRKNNAVARFDFDDVGMRFFVAQFGGFVAGFARVDDDDGQFFVNQRVRSVLHLARRIAFGVDVVNFL